MPVTTIDQRPIHVDEEGFLTDRHEWDEDLARALAALIGISLTDDHLRVIRLLREDYEQRGETATLRRVASLTSAPIKQLFALFPHKPAKKMAYVAGLPKPQGCV